MIAVDTSSLIAYLAGDDGRDVTLFDAALARNEVSLPPVVVSETLSAPNMPEQIEQLIQTLPMLPLIGGYWERTGQLRRRLLARGLRAPLADALVSQSCLDHEVALLTRDRDFKNFARYGGVALV